MPSDEVTLRRLKQAEARVANLEVRLVQIQRELGLQPRPERPKLVPAKGDDA